MRKVIPIRMKGKKEVVVDGKKLRMIQQINSRVELIQALIPIGMKAVEDLLQDEVRGLAGDRYARDGNPVVRWGQQPRSVYLGDQKVTVQAPRLRDMAAREELPLVSLQGLQQPKNMDAGLFLKVLKGLSCRNYEECAEAIPEAFGLSSSTVSRRYIRASARRLKDLMGRRLEGYDFVALILDGKRFAEDELVIAVGITVTGEKVILGLVQTATENEKSCAEFLRGLIDRGLQVEEGLLVVLDGSKGLRKAVGSALGDRAVVQRCQWHKRENVVAYLSKAQQETMRRKLQAAYGQPTYKDAREALLRLKSELKLMNLSAVTSLEEGFEETLTLHRLGLFEELGTSLKTTNLIESINAGLGQRTDKVDRWRNSDQKQRWVASALLDIEKGLNRITGHRHLPRLREALRNMIRTKEDQKMRKAA